MLKQTLKQELKTELIGWVPTLALILIDVLVLSASGHSSAIAGASVASILVGAIGRAVGACMIICKDLAEKHAFLRVRLLSFNYIWAIMAIPLYAIVFFGRFRIETTLGLVGIADFLCFYAPSKCILRFYIVGYMALSVNQARVWERMLISWLESGANVIVSILLADSFGVKGVACATMISEVIPGSIVLYWSHKGGLIRFPNLRDAFPRSIWIRVKLPLVAQVPALINSMAAMFMNSWLGELAVTWSIIHVSCDVIGGVNNVIWMVSGKHYRYHMKDSPNQGRKDWGTGDRYSAIFTVISVALAWFFVGTLGVVINTAYYFSRRGGVVRKLKSTKLDTDRVAQSKLLWCACTTTGYTCCILFVTPAIGPVTAVYCTAAVAMWLWNRY